MIDSAPASSSGPRPRRRRSSSKPRWRRRLGVFAFAATLILPVLAFGGQHLSVLVLAAFLASTSVLLLASEKAEPPALAVALLALAAYSALQLVPLPAGWVRFLSPASAAVWAEAF